MKYAWIPLLPSGELYWSSDTVERYPEPALQQNTEGRKEGRSAMQAGNKQSELEEYSS